MAFLTRAKKQDLLELSEEYGVEVSISTKVVEIRTLILANPHYNEELVKGSLDRIMEDRLKREQEEREERLRQEQVEREERRIREEREYALELKRLELSTNTQNSEIEVVRTVSEGSKVPLMQILPKFDEKTDEMGLYLVNFERRAEMARIPKRDYVAYLLSVLPSEISNMVARENTENANNYDFVKELILKRYKLNSEKLRQLFYKHQKAPEKSWKNYAHELTSYFTEWLAELEITKFEELKSLIICDQLKRRVPMEVRDHFLDDWMDLNSPSELAEKIDRYESLREGFKRKEVPKWTKQKGSFRPQYGNNKGFKNQDTPRDSGFQVKEEPTKEKDREREYERRKQFKCYECGSYSHLRPQCPKLKRNSETVAAHGLAGNTTNEGLKPYTSLGKVNGVQIPILRDTGATIDLVCRKLIQPHMYLKENVWLQTPLSESLVCLPLAEVNLECDLGHVITKAAVLGDSLDQGRYLLGNKTAELLEEMKADKNIEVHMLNAVETRAQKKLLEAKLEEPLAENSTEENSDETLCSHEEDNILPDVESEFLGSELVKLSSRDFQEAQRQSENLKPLFKLASQPSTEESKYVLFNGMLYYQKKDEGGTEKRLLVVPEQFREGLKKLCHEGTTAHLGASKTKSALVKNFFWPSCYRDIEKFVKTCDKCQRIGKSNDKKKAPLKLVPIISEIFTKINVDACGPLPITPAGNRYLITAICMSSRYPDAIPVPDICSTTIVSAFMQVFSRMGFPRELQSDQGTSFVSALTTEFLEKFGIKVLHSSVQHPQSNPVERFHRTIKRIIRVLCLESGADWEQHVPYALFALRTVPHESTGYTPAELVHGRNLRTPMTLLYENLTGQEGEEDSVVSYVFNLMNRMKRSQELAIQHMEDSQQKRKMWYDRKAVKRVFREGDLVLVIVPSRANKLSAEWMGPGKVEKQLSETNYVIKFPDKDKTHVYHINMLKPYFQRPENVNLLNLVKTEYHETESEEDIPCLELQSDTDELSSILQEIEENIQLSDKEKQQLNELVLSYSNVFSNEPGCTDLIRHDIELENEQPICAKPYRMSPRQIEILKGEVNKMLDLGVIEVGESDFTSPLILVEVPGKEARPCIDYRRLNKVTRTQFFPLPNIEQRIEIVSAARYISLLDLTRGYWQIPLSKRAQRYATFVTSFGTFRPLRMPFGLKNAPYNFSMMMAEILKNCEDFALPYLDDVAVFSETWEDHLKHLECVLKRIQDAKLHAKPSKCKFSQSHVKYLGHLVGQGQRTPAELKVQAVQDFPQPTSKTEIRAFLGLAGYYRNYIPNFSVVSAPLTDQLKGKARKSPIIWNNQCQLAFTELKMRLSENPILYTPNFSRQFILQCDASNLGIGVVLSQVNEEGEEHPILYLSKKFTEAEQKYSATEKECAAIIFAVKKLKCYLDNQLPFLIQTDHNPLVWLGQNTGTNPRLLRWALSLQHLDYEVIHRKGRLHQNADSLSRIP